MACLLHMFDIQPTKQKAKGGCQVHWKDRTYVILTFIISNTVSQ